MSSSKNTHEIRSVVVFCGSKPGASPDYVAAARALGEELARRGVTLVYGGGSGGIMGTIAEATHQNGGKVVGIIPRAMEAYCKELIGETVWVESMHERKQLMNDKGDAFAVLPGGYGTMEEFLECVTWFQLNIRNKPIVALNLRGFYEPIKQWVALAAKEGFMTDGNTKIAAFVDKVDDIFPALERREAEFDIYPMEWKQNARGEDAAGDGNMI